MTRTRHVNLRNAFRVDGVFCHVTQEADTATSAAHLWSEVVLAHPPPVNAQTPSMGGLAPCSLTSTPVPHSGQVPETLPVRL